jgi:hypothetical protein
LRNRWELGFFGLLAAADAQTPPPSSAGAVFDGTSECPTGASRQFLPRRLAFRGIAQKVR